MDRVLVVGGTGRTGRRLLEELVGRRVPARAIVRSASRLPASVSKSPLVEVVEADLLSLSDDALRKQLAGCGAVASCLGHTLSLRGVFGPPRDLVTAAVRRICDAIEASRPGVPVRYVLMSSVSVERPGGLDTRRGSLERTFVALLRQLVPPAADNQAAADHLVHGIGSGNPFVEWSVVRPDALREGGVSEYRVDEGLVNSVFRPAETRMANVAHFMAELATDPAAWARWRGKMPVVTDREGRP